MRYERSMRAKSGLMSAIAHSCAQMEGQPTNVVVPEPQPEPSEPPGPVIVPEPEPVPHEPPGPVIVPEPAPPDPNS